jgi:hypothetical protein
MRVKGYKNNGAPNRGSGVRILICFDAFVFGWKIKQDREVVQYVLCRRSIIAGVVMLFHSTYLSDRYALSSLFSIVLIALSQCPHGNLFLWSEAILNVFVTSFRSRRAKTSLTRARSSSGSNRTASRKRLAASSGLPLPKPSAPQRTHPHQPQIRQCLCALQRGTLRTATP